MPYLSTKPQTMQQKHILRPSAMLNLKTWSLNRMNTRSTSLNPALGSDSLIKSKSGQAFCRFTVECVDRVWNRKLWCPCRVAGQLRYLCRGSCKASLVNPAKLKVSTLHLKNSFWFQDLVYMIQVLRDCAGLQSLNFKANVTKVSDHAQTLKPFKPCPN